MAPDDNSPPRPVFALPNSVFSPRDLRRLINEIDLLDEHLRQLGLRSPGSEIKMPKTSQTLDDTASLNRLNLLQQDARQALKQLLETTLKQAPQLHFSFGADPSAAFVASLIVWLRREIHPLSLVTVGLQPNIGAGCVLRTTNKYFDLSLKQDFKQKRDLLKQAIQKGASV